MNKKRKYVLIVVLIIVLVFATYVLGFSNKNNENIEKTFSMLSAEAKKGAITVSVSSSANVEVSSKKEIKSTDSEIIDSIFINEGDSVEEGDLLLTFEDNSTSIDVESYKLDLIQEENKLEELEEKLSNLKIYATQSGYLGDISATVGDELPSGYLLTTITDKSIVEISGYFYESQLNKIKVGDTANVAISGSFTQVEGVVKNIKREPIPTDIGTILYEVTVEAKNPGSISNSTEGKVIIENSNGTFTSIEFTNFKEKDAEEIRLKTEGDLIKIYATSGEYVEEGTLLAEIENSSIANDIENQKLTIKKKEIELSEKIEDLDDMAVYAPISGVVTELNITEGERVSNNETLLVISDLNNLQVVIPVDELDINKIDLNKEAIVTAQAVPDIKYNAKVSKIALEGDIKNGVATFDVTLTLENTEKLKPGMTVEGEIIIDSKKDAILIPIEAVQYRQEEKYVLIQNEKEDGEPTLIPVELGLVSEDYVEIIDGLKEGDKVVYQSTSFNNQTQNSMKMISPGGMFPSNDMPRERSSGGVR